jgi:hypothetical protein
MGADWIDVAQDRDKWRAVVNTVMDKDSAPCSGLHRTVSHISAAPRSYGEVASGRQIRSAGHKSPSNRTQYVRAYAQARNSTTSSPHLAFSTLCRLPIQELVSNCLPHPLNQRAACYGYSADTMLLIVAYIVDTFPAFTCRHCTLTRASWIQSITRFVKCVTHRRSHVKWVCRLWTEMACRHPTTGGPLACCFCEGLTFPDCKKSTCYRKLRGASDVATRDWRKSRNEELHDFYSSASVILVIKWDETGGTCAAHEEE